MNALNSVAVGISGLVFAGTAALTAGAALPANAQVTVSTPQMSTSSYGRRDRERENENRTWQSNRCRDRAECANAAVSVAGHRNRVWSKQEQKERERHGRFGHEGYGHEGYGWDDEGDE